MLIVPADHRFDAAHLPFATILLALVCVLTFAMYQSDDDARVAAALEVYAEENLARYEAPLLASYAEDNDQAETESPLEGSVVLEPGFDAYVHAYWTTTEPDPEWAAARQRFEAARDRVSWYRFGVTPAEVKPASLLAHMFLHGGLLHLLGNLVFLLLFGMLLERLLGSFLFFSTYLVTGLIAAGVYVLANTGSHMPMIGASGAISGLMGAYIGVYGLRRVTFFYTVGFWFGRFTAPAMLVFPLWLGKELYGYFNGVGPIAYAAHAGGLLGGLAIALLLRRHATRALDTDEATRRSDMTRRETLAKIRQMLTDLRLEDALRTAEQAIRRSPGEFAYWQVYAEVAGRLAVGPEYHRAMTTLFVNAGQKAMTPAFLRETVRQYQERSGERQPALHGKGGAALARRYFREGSMRDVDQLLDMVFRAGGMSPAFDELLGVLMAFARKNNDRRRAQRYEQYLDAARSNGDGQAVAGPS